MADLDLRRLQAVLGALNAHAQTAATTPTTTPAPSTPATAQLPQSSYTTRVLDTAQTCIHAHLLHLLLSSSTSLLTAQLYWKNMESSHWNTLIHIIQHAPVQLWQQIPSLSQAKEIWTACSRQVSDHYQIQVQQQQLQMQQENMHGLTFTSRMKTATDRVWSIFSSYYHSTVASMAGVGLFSMTMKSLKMPWKSARNGMVRTERSLAKYREMVAALLGILVEERSLMLTAASQRRHHFIESGANEDKSIGVLALMKEGLDEMDEGAQTDVNMDAVVKIQQVEQSLALAEAVVTHIQAWAKMTDKEIRAALIPQDVNELLMSSSTLSGRVYENEAFQKWDVDRTLALVKSVEQLPPVLHQVTQKLGPPTTLIRSWLPIFVGVMGIRAIIQAWHGNAREIQRLAHEAVAAARGFVNDWIVGPILDIYNTIRHRENRLALMGSDSLNSDLESLERMVVLFARDHGVPAAELEEISASVQRGDLTVVLQNYEKEMVSPFVSTISGDLIRSLLIQVQKAKVDLELAMSALDKLLRANELNFAFLAVIPTLALVSFSWTQLRKFSRRTSSIGRLKGYQIIRSSMREIERLLNRANKSPTDTHTRIAPTDSGLLLCELYVLQQRASDLPRQHRRMFREDVSELSDWGLTPSQRLSTVQRMGRTYAFLFQ